MTPSEESRNALLLLISLQERNGHLAPESATMAREHVETLYQSRAPALDGLADAIEQGLPIGPDGRSRICANCGPVLSLGAHKDGCPWPMLVYGYPRTGSDRRQPAQGASDVEA
jgi:hypothetical protein